MMRRLILTSALAALAIGVIFFNHPGLTRADDTAVYPSMPNYTVNGTVLAPDGTPNMQDVYVIMTTDLGFTAKIRDTYDIYKYDITSSFSITQANSSSMLVKNNPIRPMVYWVCILNGNNDYRLPSDPAAVYPILPRCQKVDFRTQTAYDLTFQYRSPNKIIHGLITDDSGQPLATVFTPTNHDNLFYVMGSWQATPGYYPGGDNMQTWTDSTGHYVLALSDNGGTYNVGPYPTSKNYMLTSGRSQTVTFNNDTTPEDMELNFVIDKVGTSVIIGRIVDKQGHPEPGFNQKQSISVYAYSTEAPYSGQYVNVGVDGTFSLHLKAGTYNFFVNYWPLKSDDKRVDYPTQVVTITDDQTIDLGDIYPQENVWVNPDQPSKPTVVFVNGNERVTSQSGTIKEGDFREQFDSASRIDATNTSGVNVTNGMATISTTAASSNSGGLAVSSLTAKSTLTDSLITSKPVTPKNIVIKTVTIGDIHNTTGSGQISYEMSPDGRTWTAVVPGKTTTMPSGWDTTSGLRWRARLSRSSSDDAVKISGVQIKYTYQSLRAAPHITKVKITRQGASSKIVVSGKYFSSSAVAYVGGRKVPVSIKNGKATLTIKRSSYPKKNYQITIVNPDLQLSATPKINVWNNR